MEGLYVIWDSKTGIYDGAYRKLEDAMDRYKDMSFEHPSGWFVVQIVCGEDLSDLKFHTNQFLFKE